MDINQIVNISARAWSLPVLARLYEGTPGRQAPLIAATGATRTAFSQSLDHLIDIGMVERNPGYGHPLRPEFRLTQNGALYGKIASKILRNTEPEAQKLLRRTWSLPILVTLNDPLPFGSIKQNLTNITDRALSQSLQSLENQAWIRRDIQPLSRPPKPLYIAINHGAKICEFTHIDGANL